MTQKTVWLNTHFNCIQPFRDADEDGGFRIVTSYPSRKYLDVLLADAFELEPKLNDEQYVQFALDFVQRHNVDVFLPGRRVNEIARNREAFEALGVKVILAADPSTLAVLDNKGLFYDSLAADNFELPDYCVAGSPEDFEAAVNGLQQRNAIVCFKPTVGIFGYGFRIIETEANSRLLAGVDRGLITDLPGALQVLGGAGQFEEQIVLEYLPGEERSVDCLAHEGKLVRSVVRRKLDDGSRVLEHYPELEAQTARLVSHLKLHGLFNVQYKNKEGKPFLLEINARMSGGISMSCLSGVVFPYWAVKAALDQESIKDIPVPIPGSVRVAEITKAVVLFD